MVSKVKDNEKVTVAVDFFDLQENVMRYAGEEMEVTKERLEQVKQFVESVDAKDEKSKA